MYQQPNNFQMQTPHQQYFNPQPINYPQNNYAGGQYPQKQFQPQYAQNQQRPLSMAQKNWNGQYGQKENQINPMGQMNQQMPYANQQNYSMANAQPYNGMANGQLQTSIAKGGLAGQNQYVNQTNGWNNGGRGPSMTQHRYNDLNYNGRQTNANGYNGYNGFNGQVLNNSIAQNLNQGQYQTQQPQFQGNNQMQGNWNQQGYFGAQQYQNQNAQQGFPQNYQQRQGSMANPGFGINQRAQSQSPNYPGYQHQPQSQGFPPNLPPQYQQNQHLLTSNVVQKMTSNEARNAVGFQGNSNPYVNFPSQPPLQNVYPYRDSPTQDQSSDDLYSIASGNGKITYPNGIVYDGEWSNHQKAGFGVLYDEKGEKIFSGEWRDDLFHGQGILNNVNARKLKDSFDFRDMNEVWDCWKSYEGEFRKGKMHGMGVLVLSNGEKFNGKFREGMIDGEGSFYKKSGQVVLGVWNENELEKML